RIDGWVQVSSVTTGLVGSYLAGDFTNTLEGSDSAPVLSTQVVPVIRDDQTSRTELIVLNPGSVSSNVQVALYNAGGGQTSVFQSLLTAHAALRITSAALSAAGTGTLSARISASTPVSATAIIERGDALLFSSGQPIDQPASIRVAPQFMSGGGFDS